MLCGMRWWDVYLQELNCLTCSWASLVPLPPSHWVMLPFSDCLHINWCQSFRKIFLEGVKGVITVITKVLLDCTPEKLNEVELTMKFWEKDAKVSSGFNHFLNQWLLFSKVRLLAKKSPSTAWSGTNFTLWLLALQVQSRYPQATFFEHSLNSFELIRVCWMVMCKNHWLGNFYIIMHEPAISKLALTPSRIQIHLRNLKCIQWISCMPLGVVHHN